MLPYQTVYCDNRTKLRTQDGKIIQVRLIYVTWVLKIGEPASDLVGEGDASMEEWSEWGADAGWGNGGSL